MMPLVSVIIPTYNRSATIKRSIDSVLGQTYEDLELIIVDDHSSDDTVKIVNSYEDNRISLIRLSANFGANHARNKGIRAARGEYIAFQDSDDEWLENKLEIQIEYMLRTGKKVCCCPYTLFDGNKSRVLPRYAENQKMYGDKIIEILRKKNVVSTQTLVIHKDVFKTVGMFDEEMNRMQDYEFAIRICQHYEIGYIIQPLINVYRMENCISNDRSALSDACKKIMAKHMDFIDPTNFLNLYLFNCKWYTKNGICWEYLDEISDMTHQIDMAEMESYCNKAREYMIKWYNFFCRNIKDNEFVIYGAGRYGRDIYKTLKDIGAVPKNFWVTQRPENVYEIDRIPVLELPDKVDGNLPVIVAVGKEIQSELVQELVSRNISNYYIYPFVGI